MSNETAGAALGPAAAEPGALESRRSGSLLIELLGWIAVVLSAAALRFASLGDAALTTNEGRTAFQAWSFAGGRVPPGWSGSTLAALEAGLIKLFGASDAMVRLPAAAGGTVLVAVLFLFRPYLGRRAALFAALLAAISPVLVLDGRSAAGQPIGAVLALLWLALALRFLEAPHPRPFILLAAGFFLGLGSDASFLGVLLLILVPLGVRAAWKGDQPVTLALRTAVSRRDWWLSAAPLSLAALLLTLTRFGTTPDRLRPAALASWAAMFVPERAGVPWHYLPDVLTGYELPLLILGLVGAWLVVRRFACPTPFVQVLPWAGAAGLLLALTMASRDPASLDVAVLPLCLLGGLALAAFSRVAERARPDALDALLATCLLIGLVYAFLESDAIAGSPSPPSLLLPLAGGFVALICLAGSLVRIRYEGAAVSAASLTLVCVAGLLFELHGAGSVAFGNGDEFLAGQHTLAVAPVMARLMQANDGGVSTVTDSLLPPLAWYLRDTTASGGHGGARIVIPGTPLPPGFATLVADALVARSWSPGGFDSTGMLRWWIFRQPWGASQDSHAELIAEGR